MRRAKKLLKACKVLNNTPTSVISYVSGIAIYVVVAICFINLILTMVFSREKIISLTEQISYLSIIIVLLIIRNIYTGFFQDKRKGTRKNLLELMIHLPVSKKDFILAQYINSLELFLPAFIFIIILIGFNLLTETMIREQFELGAMILGFGITYILISLEKGLLIYYYVDPRIREFGYLLLTFVWIGINYILEANPNHLIDEILNNGIGEMWFEAISSMSGIGGLVLLIIVLGIGHFCHTKLPEALERSKC